jgi:hypothetical protein
MTKSELALKIGSQTFINFLKDMFKSWAFALIVLGIGLFYYSDIWMTHHAVMQMKSRVFPEVKKKISQYEGRPGKISRKTYEVEGIKKLHPVSPISFYEIISKEFKKNSKNVSHSVVLVAPDFEEKFLKEIESKKLTLEFIEGKENSPRPFYPELSLWPEILKQIEADSILLYKSGYKSWKYHSSMLSAAEYSLSPNTNRYSNEDIFNSALTWLALIYTFIFVLRAQRKRRNIFLKNFKVEHLSKAEPCTIELEGFSIFKKTGNVFRGQGQIYRVSGKSDTYVIYNGTKEKVKKGYLLKYEDQYYFIHQKWMPTTNSKQVA